MGRPVKQYRSAKLSLTKSEASALQSAAMNMHTGLEQDGPENYGWDKREWEALIRASNKITMAQREAGHF